MYLKDDLQLQYDYIAILLKEISSLDPFRYLQLIPKLGCIYYAYQIHYAVSIRRAFKLIAFQEILQFWLQKMRSRRTEQNHALQTLQQMVSEGSLTTWEENFKPLILHIFNVLAVNDVTLKRSALKLLTKIWYVNSVK